MAKKIIHGIGSVLGVTKKKKPAAAAPVVPEEGKPIVTPLASLPADSPLRKRLARRGGSDASTILGIGGTLGG